MGKVKLIKPWVASWGKLKPWGGFFGEDKLLSNLIKQKGKKQTHTAWECVKSRVHSNPGKIPQQYKDGSIFRKLVTLPGWWGSMD